MRALVVLGDGLVHLPARHRQLHGHELPVDLGRVDPARRPQHLRLDQALEALADELLRGPAQQWGLVGEPAEHVVYLPEVEHCDVVVRRHQVADGDDEAQLDDSGAPEQPRLRLGSRHRVEGLGNFRALDVALVGSEPGDQGGGELQQRGDFPVYFVQTVKDADDGFRFDDAFDVFVPLFCVVFFYWNLRTEIKASYQYYILKKLVNKIRFLSLLK